MKKISKVSADVTHNIQALKVVESAYIEELSLLHMLVREIQNNPHIKNFAESCYSLKLANAITDFAIFNAFQNNRYTAKHT